MTTDIFSTNHASFEASVQKGMLLVLSKKENLSMNIFKLFLFLVYSIEILELFKIPNENVLIDRHEEVLREKHKNRMNCFERKYTNTS